MAKFVNCLPLKSDNVRENEVGSVFSIMYFVFVPIADGDVLFYGCYVIGLENVNCHFIEATHIGCHHPGDSLMVQTAPLSDFLHTLQSLVEPGSCGC